MRFIRIGLSPLEVTTQKLERTPSSAALATTVPKVSSINSRAAKNPNKF